MRRALVLSLVSVVAMSSTACRGPLRNPDIAKRSVTQVAKLAEHPADDSHDPMHTDADAATSDPFRLADFAIDVPLQPITFDPTGGSSWSNPSGAVHSPLWVPLARPADGRWPTPPGRVQNERAAAALLISLALIATSAWTIGR